MMKRIAIFALAAVAASTALSAVVSSEYAKYAETRRYCVSRVVQDGNVITTWHRNGKPDWILPSVETNTLRTITGKPQNNPLQNQIVTLTNELAKIDAQLQAAVVKYLSASNRAVVAETRIANATSSLETKIAEYETKRDEAKLPTTKAIYQAVIDLLTDIKNKLSALMEQL